MINLILTTQAAINYYNRSMLSASPLMAARNKALIACPFTCATAGNDYCQRTPGSICNAGAAIELYEHAWSLVDVKEPPPEPLPGPPVQIDPNPAATMARNLAGEYASFLVLTQSWDVLSSWLDRLPRPPSPLAAGKV